MSVTVTIEQEFQEIDAANDWQPRYQDIRNQSSDYSHKVAKYAENRNRNRYRDVSPYDHSRVILQNTDNDYINASLVVNEEAERNYILTQGPLPNTCCHFWLMVWQQKTKAVVMLNRIVEKDSVKCAQYWPAKEDDPVMFKETGFCVRLKSEDVKSYYTVRQLQLENTNTGESRMIFHFHYTTWPDFGVPESPASFLNFLFKVRESGSLSPEHGPAVIHCSAGIGRSGTFSLVDTCLVLMEKREDPFSVDIKQVLLNMRKYRMGLIQTPDQLRFSYMAVIEGAKYIMGDSTIQNRWKELSKEDQAPSSERSPPNSTKLMTEKYNGNSVGIENQEQAEDILDAELSSTIQNTADANADITFRKRLREDRRVNTAQMVQQMKHRLSEAERKRKRWLYWKPILIKIGFGTAIFIGIYSCWKSYFQGTLIETKGAIQTYLRRWCNCWCNCVGCHKDAVKCICGTRRISGCSKHALQHLCNTLHGYTSSYTSANEPDGIVQLNFEKAPDQNVYVDQLFCYQENIELQQEKEGTAFFKS